MKDSDTSKYVGVVDNRDSEPEVFYANYAVTLKLESGNYREIILHFQLDIGARFNVMPVELCKKTSKDYELRRVMPLNAHLKAYGIEALS